MKVNSILIAASLAFLAVFSCGKDKTEDTPVPEPQNNISLSMQSVSFDGTALGEEDIDITADAAWTVEGLTEGIRQWITISAESGQGNSSVKVSCIEQNPFGKERLAILIFKCGNANAPLLIRQSEDSESTIETDVDIIEFGKAVSEEKTVQIITPKAWSVDGYDEELQDWLSITPLSGDGNGSITLKTLKPFESSGVREASFSIRIDRINSVSVGVTQLSSLEINVDPAELEFPGNEPATKTVTVTTTSTSVPWTVEGYDESVKAWLSLDKETASGTETTVSISTLSANMEAEARQATLKFCFSDDTYAELSITQPIVPLEEKVFKWTNGLAPIVPAGASYNGFPWTDATSAAATTNYYDGEGGSLIFTGNITATRSYILKDTAQSDGVTYEFGPTLEPSGSVLTYYAQFANTTTIRMRNSYIKLPAIAGFRLSKVNMTCSDTRSTAAVTISSDKKAENPFEGCDRLSFSKTKPVDVEIEGTNAATSYYICLVNDKTITGFTITYTEVR